MKAIEVVDRLTQTKETEKIYGGKSLHLLYTPPFSFFLQPLICRSAWVSQFYGWLQSKPKSQKKILPFIKKFEINTEEFTDPVETFRSFNDFFIRKLKPSARPIDSNPQKIIMPADGRYLFYPNIQETDGFVVKNQKFNLSSLLQDPQLAAKYEQGSLVIARLCPTDYHRYHFPIDCVPSKSICINGSLYSVNPIATRKRIHIFSENKRELTTLKTKQGNVLFIEIGATNVGSIHQTYQPEKPYSKGIEKGYFSFGGSSILMLFPHNFLNFDRDLLELSQHHQEIKCLMGQSLGTLNSIKC